MGATQNKMKKFGMIIVFLLGFSHCIWADRLSITGDDAIDYGTVTTILWKSSPISEHDQERLFKISKSKHDDVASYALTAAIVHDTQNLPEMLFRASSREKGNIFRIADHITALRKKGDVLSQLTQEMTGKPLSRYNTPQLEDYYRDIIVYSILRKARAANAPPAIPKKINFNWGQKTLLTYAAKPTSQAFDYLVSRMAEEHKSSDKAVACAVALTAYENVFFDEAMSQINDAERSTVVKNTLYDYLLMNRTRLNAAQRERLDKLTASKEKKR